MLVLNRRNGEEIRISNNITIRIIGTSEGNVKLGIIAPQDIAILRGELYQNVKENVINASKESGLTLKEVNSFKINKLKCINDE